MSEKTEKSLTVEEGVARFVTGSQAIAEAHQVAFSAAPLETFIGKAGPAARRGSAKVLQQAVGLFEREVGVIERTPDLCRDGQKKF